MPRDDRIQVENCPAKVSFITQRRGLAPPGELQRLIEDALADFKTHLLHHLEPDFVWYVVEKSAGQLMQCILPRRQLLEHLEGIKGLRHYTASARAALGAPVGSEFIRWIAVVLRHEGRAFQLANGRLIRAALNPTA